MPARKRIRRNCFNAYKAAAFAAILLVASQSAASAQVEFRGEATLSGFSPECAPNWSGSQDVRLRFYPPSVGDNDATTRISIFFNYYAENYVARGSLGNSFKRAPGGKLGSNVTLFQKTAQAKRISQNPATITVSTTSMKIKVRIKNFSDTAGCEAVVTSKKLKRHEF